jgi:accessory colonization factor AcfC
MSPCHDAMRHGAETGTGCDAAELTLVSVTQTAGSLNRSGRSCGENRQGRSRKLPQAKKFRKKIFHIFTL